MITILKSRKLLFLKPSLFSCSLYIYVIVQAIYVLQKKKIMRKEVKIICNTFNPLLIFLNYDAKFEPYIMQICLKW